VTDRLEQFLNRPKQPILSQRDRDILSTLARKVADAFHDRLWIEERGEAYLEILTDGGVQLNIGPLLAENGGGMCRVRIAGLDADIETLAARFIAAARDKYPRLKSSPAFP
jgi:hypothetical protein